MRKPLPEVAPEPAVLLRSLNTRDASALTGLVLTLVRKLVPDPAVVLRGLNYRGARPLVESIAYPRSQARA